MNVAFYRADSPNFQCNTSNWDDNIPLTNKTFLKPRHSYDLLISTAILKIKHIAQSKNPTNTIPVSPRKTNASNAFIESRACKIALNGSHLPDKTVIKAKAKMAPAKTVSRGCLMAIIAAIKNVLSPISETKITDRAAAKAWKKPKLSAGSSVPGVPFKISVFYNDFFLYISVQSQKHLLLTGGIVLAVSSTGSISAFTIVATVIHTNHT